MAYKLPDHYRYALRAAERAGFTMEELDRGGGYLFRISHNGVSILSGAGRISAYPVNSSTATSISKDKDFTNRLLEERGIPTFGGRCFFLTDEFVKLRTSGFEVEDAREYVREIGLPCFCKPLSSSRGDLAEVIESAAQFESYVARAAKRHDAIIIQKVFKGPEYRVFVIDGRAIYAVDKVEISIVGDGARSIEQILEEMNKGLRGTGLSPLGVDQESFLRDGKTVRRGYVPLRDERIVVPGRRNFSISGEVGEILSPCPAELEELAARSAAAIGLRVAGVDIMRTEDGLRVIEVNGNPGIHALESGGRFDLIEAIWIEVLEKAFLEARSRAGGL